MTFTKIHTPKLKMVLHCPRCGSKDNLTVEGRYDSHYYPYILNCPNCGKFEIDHIEGIVPIEDHADNCQCNKCRN